MRRRGRLALAAAAVATLGAMLIAPMASGQDGDNMLAVRSIDGTNQKDVKITFLYTGAPDDLKSLVIREDGEAKKVTDLTNMSKTDQRLGTVYVVDLSGSMGDDGALGSVTDGLKEIAGSLPPGDEMAIVSFSNAPVVETAFTDNADQLNEAIDAMAAPSDGKTAMWDGIKRASELFVTRDDLQPNIVLITDGVDDSSGTSFDDAKAAVISAKAGLFAIELDHTGEVDTESISSIMDRAGGASFTASKGKSTGAAFTSLAATLQSQYVASYASSVKQGQVDVTLSVGALERLSLIHI